MKFRNKANGYIEERNTAWLWTFLFGPFYFIYLGIWAHVFVWLVLSVFFWAAFGAPGTMFVWCINIVYAIFASGIVRSNYMRKGWEPVRDDGRPISSYENDAPLLNNPIATGHSRVFTQESMTEHPQLSPQKHQSSAEETKTCPFCAEEVKAAAIKCKHCGSELAA